jgi:hypothetical protein
MDQLSEPKKMATRRKSLKNRVAAAIYSSSTGWQVFWAVVIGVAIFLCFVLAIVRK